MEWNHSPNRVMRMNWRGRVGSSAMRQPQDNKARLGDVDALLRAGRPSNAETGLTPSGRDNARTRKRRLVAMFCRMLGEQVPGREGMKLSGGSPLAPRQRQTLELLLDGKSEKEIALGLTISRHTVHVYVKSLYKRFGVSSRGELLARWVRR